MEPQLSSPEFQKGPSTEGEPVSSTYEFSPNTLPNPEIPLNSPEQAKNAEQLAADHQGIAMPVIPKQQPLKPISADNQAQDNAGVSQTPTTARDEDTIEREWISKVKSIISSTSDDPYKQQSLISRLMADYVLKRYGRKVGKVEE